MVRVIKLTKDNKFEKFVDIRDEFKEISFPVDISKADLPEGYAFAREEEMNIKEDVFSTYNTEPVLENKEWVIKVINTPIVMENIKISEVTMRQARLQLLELGLLDEVEAMVSQDKKNQIEWEYSNVVKRDSTLINTIKVLLNLTDEQIDQMFLDASNL